MTIFQTLKKSTFWLMSHITQVAKQGGVPVFRTFSDFFLKNRFLSDYVVPACPKYISGKLRSFSKNFSKKIFHTALFENFLPNSLSVADAKMSLPRGWEHRKSPMTQKIYFFKVQDIDTPIQPRKKQHQTNVGSALKKF